jgi:ATP-dependent RNA helicase SUPV3L1/SUV3
MVPVLTRGRTAPPCGYRALGQQALRVDRAEALLREAHGTRAATRGALTRIDPAPALALGLTTAAYARLLQLAGFRPVMPRPLAAGAAGPAAPLRWRWQPPVAANRPTDDSPRAEGAFAALARLVA